MITAKKLFFMMMISMNTVAAPESGITDHFDGERFFNSFHLDIGFSDKPQ